MSCDFAALARPAIRRLQPFVPPAPAGRLAQSPSPAHTVCLANNENPLGISPLASQAMIRALRHAGRYPDAAPVRLKAALAERHDVAPAQIVLGNGSNEVLELVARVFAGPEDEIVYSQYGFLVYPIVTQAVGARGVEVPAHGYGHDLEAMAAAIGRCTRLVFIANPNNPTGTWLSREQLRAFLERVPPQVVVVVDEAYFEYVEATDYPNAIRWIKAFPNLVVTRTFSKAYGLAGARVGYAVAGLAIAELLDRLRQPFNLNGPGLAGALAVLEDEAYLARTRAVNRAGMVRLTALAERMGLAHIPSVGNFLALELGPEATAMQRALAQGGVLVRPLTNYAMPRHVRVSVGLPEENARLAEVLEAALARGAGRVGQVQ